MPSGLPDRPKLLREIWRSPYYAMHRMRIGRALFGPAEEAMKSFMLTGLASTSDESPAWNGATKRQSFTGRRSPTESQTGKKPIDEYSRKGGGRKSTTRHGTRRLRNSKTDDVILENKVALENLSTAELDQIFRRLARLRSAGSWKVENFEKAAGPVSRILSAGLLRQDGHSSGPRIAERL